MSRIIAALACTLLFGASSIAVCAERGAPLVHAQAASPAPADPKEIELENAATAVGKVMVVGPAKIHLNDQGTLDLPGSLSYVGKPEAARFARAIGNTVDDKFIGLVFDKDADWFAYVSFSKVGYVKDEEAKDWNPDDLLGNIKSHTDEGNKDRVQRGFPALNVLGWIQAPKYDAAQHRLVWSISASEGDANIVNYNTYVLGREGFFTINLVSTESQIDNQKKYMTALLSGLNFDPTKKYDDFVASSDNVAAFGIAALVGGVAAKKLGLLALAAAFFAKSAKLMILAAIGAFVAIKKFFFGAKSSPKIKSEDKM